jgi:hypothetical protein
MVIMATTIEYKNIYGRPISQQQAEQMTNFNRVIKINGIVSYIESYWDSRISRVIYYKESGESYEQVYLTLKQQYVHAGALFIHQRTFYGNYSIENTRHYLTEQDIFTENRSLLDAEGRTICWENLSELPFNGDKTTRKYFYDAEIHETVWPDDIDPATYYDPEFLVFEAVYNEDGSLNRAKLNPHSFEDYEIFIDSRFNELAQRCGLSPAMKLYYKTAVFLPPL